MPTYPSTKYGYIVPEQGEGELLKVTGFREKPDEATAEKLVSDGALWNCGVFCFKLSMAAGWLAKYGVGVDYDKMVADYEKLPKKSFDYRGDQICGSVEGSGYMEHTDRGDAGEQHR